MALKQRMTEQQNEAERRAMARNHLMQTDKNYRAERLVESLNRVDALGGLDKLPKASARNVALGISNQLRHMKKLTEMQTREAFYGFEPENMLRLVRLSMPNCVRSKIFTDFTLESMKDSVKYIVPTYTTTASGKDLDDRHSEFPAEDPWKNGKKYADGGKTVMYESTEDRYVQELANVEGTVTAAVAGGSGVDPVPAYATFTFAGAAGTAAAKFGAKSELYIDGYCVVYGKGGEQDIIAMQNKGTGKFLVNGEDYDGVEVELITAADGTKSVKVSDTKGTIGEGLSSVKCFGRFDSETDFEGNYLGEVYLDMKEHMFSPRPTSIGVSWSQLTELSMSYSFDCSAEDYLMTYAAQEIRVALDYQAIKLGYRQAKLNGPDYFAEFKADYSNTAPSKDGYFENAQTLMSAIDRVGDQMLNNIKRGGVSRLVGGPAAASYCRLNKAYSTKGKMPAVGAHQLGQLDEIPLFKVPSSIIPNDEMLCVWKNDLNENDVSIAFGTLVPFWSSGIIQRKNFYKEAGLDSLGDWAILEPRYLSLLKITGIKDGATN